VCSSTSGIIVQAAKFPFMRAIALTLACLARAGHGRRANYINEQMQHSAPKVHQISHKAGHATSSAYSLAELEQVEATARTGVPPALKLLAMFPVALTNPAVAFSPPNLRPVVGMRGHKLSKFPMRPGAGVPGHKHSVNNTYGVRTGSRSALRMNGMSMQPSPYEVLGLDPGASKKAISNAYRDLMKRYHPDVKGGSVERATEINQAYEQVLEGWEAAAAVEEKKEEVYEEEEEVGEVDVWDSWSGASVAPGDPTEIWENPWNGESYWLTPGQRLEMEEMARRGWEMESYVMLREFRWNNDRWWGGQEKKRREGKL